LNPCEQGLGCNRKFLNCKPLALEGEACQGDHYTDTVCAKGLLCYNGICGTVGGQGSPCSDDKTCELFR
jgi:hypothetical protein